MDDELQRTLDCLQRDDSFRVDAVLKANAHARCERVFFVGASGGEMGPFVRKIFRAQDGLGAAWRHVLEAERAGKRFVHLPHIIDCYDAGEYCVVIMEHIDGKTLDDVVYRRGPSVDLAHELFPGACDAVSELHDSFSPPLIHRDIKPSNLMLFGDTVILLDLGITRAFDSEAATDTVKFGTRGFAPPEQFGFGQTDVRSDVYALGMLLFYLMVGQIPEPSSVDRVMRERKIPKELRAVVLKAAAFDPQARYASSEQLKTAALRAFSPAGESSIEPVSPGVPEALRRAPAALSAHETPHAAMIANPPAGDAPSRDSSGRSARFESFARASAPFGRVWDALLLSMSALFLLVVALSCIFPNEEAAQIPFAARVWEYAAMWLLCVCPAAVLCDPRPLKRFSPRFASLGFAKRLVLMFLAAGVSVTIIGVVNSVFAPR